MYIKYALQTAKDFTFAIHLKEYVQVIGNTPGAYRFYTD